MPKAPPIRSALRSAFDRLEAEINGSCEEEELALSRVPSLFMADRLGGRVSEWFRLRPRRFGPVATAGGGRSVRREEEWSPWRTDGRRPSASSFSLKRTSAPRATPKWTGPFPPGPVPRLTRAPVIFRTPPHTTPTRRNNRTSRNRNCGPENQAPVYWPDPEPVATVALAYRSNSSIDAMQSTIPSTKKKN